MTQDYSTDCDIFLSYSSGDRERIEPLVKALQNIGWEVWWDTKIRPGEKFSTVIDEGLNKSKCVIVVWSLNSIESHWVITEANEALGLDKLIPVMIDDVKPPLQFRMIEAAKLIGWSPGDDSEEFDLLVDTIKLAVGEPKPPEPATEEPKPDEPRSEDSGNVPRDEDRVQDGDTDEPTLREFSQAKRRLPWVLGTVGVCATLVTMGIWLWPTPPESQPYSDPGVAILDQSYLDSFAATNEGKELNALLDPLKDWPVELKNLRATGSSKEGYGKFTKPRTSSADSDSSIRWTYSDSKTATYIISKSFLEGGWVQTFTAAKGHPPVVTVGPIRDKTDEQIDMNTLIFDLTVELSFRSNVEFKHSWNWGLMPRNARWDQVEMISAESATRLRDSLGIDVFLQGSITRAGKTFGSYQHTEYVLELEAIETETMMRLWSDFHLTDKPNITPNSP